MPRVRVHQHVNPLATYFRKLPVEPIDFEKIFPHADRPLFLDVGCGRGRFIQKMAALDRNTNFLGLEIRQPLVDEANEIAAERGIENLHYEFCNATLAAETLFDNLPNNILKAVSIQFPDPWFKKRHAKRRMVKPKLAEVLTRLLRVDGAIFVQSDVEFLAEEMFEMFREQKVLSEVSLDENPFPVKTERELSVENRELPVWRKLFKKTAD
ncbi:MAG: tRNA (guanosine(46)-N7)-methyltransferase TrmB [Pyrinomonadaceae bacterium]|nr:tRNA (guanosine(46)-N7)-methyltransferase TrmB [Pyrinomonadaceae bacterium]